MLQLSVSAVILSTILPAGCAIEGQRSPVPGPPPLDRMDVTMGSYGQGREQQLLLVTMEADLHDTMVHRLPISSRSNSPSQLPLAYADFLDELSDRYGIVRVADWPLASLGIHCLVFELGGRRDRASTVAELNRDQRIETAQAMQLFETMQTQDSAPPSAKNNELASPSYDDPYLPLQHGLVSLQAEQSHRWASGAGVTVAVIDTGMDLQHQDLAERVLAPRNFVDRDEARFQEDIHGTAIAGVIAASANNGSGMVGMAPDATMLPLKACWQEELAGDGATCNSFTLAKALNVAIQSEVDVINLSLAGPRDALLERLVRTALERDVIVVGATTPAGVEQFPASVPGVIAATADVSEFSAGVLAPGHKVLSARPQDNYQFFDGSSFSAAHIAGLAALVKEMEENGKPIDLLALLERTADPRTGEVSACRALASLAGEGTGVCQAGPSS